MLKILFLTFILLTSGRASAEMISDLTFALKDDCKSISSLSIKKAMIELNYYSNSACEMPFTLNLLNICHIECRKLMIIYNKIKAENSGTIIGR